MENLIFYNEMVSQRWVCITVSAVSYLPILSFFFLLEKRNQIYPSSKLACGYNNGIGYKLSTQSHENTLEGFLIET
jgi:hypothetical protein